MSGGWLISYVVMWLLLVAACAFLVGVLRQIGMMQRQLDQYGARPQEDVLPQDDGLALGTNLPRFELATVNDPGIVRYDEYLGRRVLLVFMSPMCESCQGIVDPLNELVERAGRDTQPIAIMRADVQACRAFLSIFPMDMPVICDEERNVTRTFRVHHNPFGLLYDERGILVSKGVIIDRDSLLAVLGDEEARARVRQAVLSQTAAAGAGVSANS